MANITWLEGNKIQVKPPKNPKKITGTRFATILGLNPWSTEFEMWCAITRTYEKPFEDNIYTIAGKTIEPKQAEYMKKSYGMDIVTPTDIFGENYFSETRGDFFSGNRIVGGMWDYLERDLDGNIESVLEMKTTKRIEDWQDDIPEYYALQAALYAYLLNIDRVIMVASFLENKDYENPSEFVPTINNTITVEFKVSERYPDIIEKVAHVEKWWIEHVVTGISPAYDEKKDAEILKELRTNTLSPDTDIKALIKEAENIKEKLDRVSADVAEDEKRLKVINDIIKEHAVSQFREGDIKAEIAGNKYTWTVSKSETTSIDKKALEADGLLEKYQTVKPQYRVTVK